MMSLFVIRDASTLLSTGFKDLQEQVKDAPVGVDSNERSYYISVPQSSFETLQKDKLP
jgi:hypothetical protein